MTSSPHPPADWYPDPAGSGGERYWDGNSWSQVTRPARFAPGPVPGFGAPIPSGPVLAGWWMRVFAAIIDSIVFMLPSSLVSFVVSGDSTQKLQEWYIAQIEAITRGDTTGSPFPPMDLLTPLIWASLVASVLFIIYRTVMVAMTGATVGQLVLRLRVVRDGDPAGAGSPAGYRLGWGTSALRATLGVLFGQIPGLNLINSLMPLFNAKKQTLHDMAAKTVVVKY